MILKAANGDTQDELVDHAVEEEALERYYRRRIREVNKDDAPARGSRGFVSGDELRKLADEHSGDRPIRP